VTKIKCNYNNLKQIKTEVILVIVRKVNVSNSTAIVLLSTLPVDQNVIVKDVQMFQTMKKEDKQLNP
jgi:hypothetical protein